MTEENPPVGWFGHAVEGYPDLGWIETCRWIASGFLEREVANLQTGVNGYPRGDAR
jgi:hypothetical protein